MVPAALTCVAAALLAGAAYVSVPLTMLVILLVQVGLAATWHRLVDAPAALGGFAIGSLAGLAADVVLLLDDEGGRIGPVVAVAAGVVPVAIVQQILRPVDVDRGRERVVESMSASVTVGVLAVGLATVIPLSRSTAGQDALLVGLAALAVAALVADLLAGWSPGLGLGVVVGAVVGFGLGVGVGLADGSGLGAVALVAVGPAIVAVTAVRAGWLAGPAARLDPALAALPLALAAPVLFALASATVT